MNVAERLDPAGIDVGKPNIARVYDAFLGGTDNFAADRAFIEMGCCTRRLTRCWPRGPTRRSCRSQ